MSPSLAGAERLSLLVAARRAVLALVAGEPPPETGVAGGRLVEPRGVFVTLRVRGDLRGCVGTIENDTPLVRSVAQCAAAAASQDPRFPPLTASEVADLSIDISVLDPPAEIRGPAEILLGRHGLIVSRAGRRGLLLPQVAIEQGWDRLRFLRETCRKAGLEGDAWSAGALVQAFTAEVFSEDESSPSPPSSRHSPRSGSG